MTDMHLAMLHQVIMANPRLANPQTDLARRVKADCISAAKRMLTESPTQKANAEGYIEALWASMQNPSMHREIMNEYWDNIFIGNDDDYDKYEQDFVDMRDAFDW